MDLFFSEQDISDYDINQIIRPKRIAYSNSDLGNSIYFFQKKMQYQRKYWITNLNKILGPATKNINGVQTSRKDFQAFNSKREKLQCSLYLPSNDKHNKLLIIYLHGNSGCRLEANPVVFNLIPQGFHICSYDSSGCGLSEGKFITLGINEKDDLHSVINQLKQQFGYTNFILWGRSMGAVTCLLYSIQLLGMYMFSNNNNGVVGLVVDSAFSNFGTLSKEIAEKKISSFLVSTGLKHLRNKLKKTLNGIDLFEINLSNNLSQLKLPAIFAYSDQDQVVSSKHTHNLYDNYGGPKQKTQFRGDHNAMRDSNYFNSIINFLNSYLPMNKNSIQPGFNNIQNFQVFNKSMNMTQSMNIKSPMQISAPSKLNQIPLNNPHQINIQQTPLNHQVQTQKNITNSHIQNINEYGFQQYINQINNQTNGQQQYNENQKAKDKLKTENIMMTSNRIPISPFNIHQKLNQSVSNLTHLTQQQNQIQAIQSQQIINKSFGNNENRLLAKNDINSSFIYSQTPVNNHDKQIYQNSQYQLLQSSSQTPQILNKTLPVNMLPSNNITSLNTSIPVVLQGQQYINSPQIGQASISARYENKTNQLRSSSTVQFIKPPVQQLGNSNLSINNFKSMSFVQNNSPQLGNYYQTQIQQKYAVPSGYPYNQQINSRIVLK